MLSKKSETIIANFIINLFEGEKSVEIAKNNLANSYNFDAYQIFNRLDRERKNFIDEYNIAEFLKLNKIHITAPEARIIVSFYDSDNDGNLNYTELLNLILSDSNITIRKKTREMIGYENGFTLPNAMEYSLSKLLEKELELARRVEKIIRELSNRLDYNLVDIYSLLKGQETYISEASLKRFLIRSGIDFTEEDVTAAFKRLDIDRDSRITYNEFGKLFVVATADSSKSTNNHFIDSNKKNYNSSNYLLSLSRKSTSLKIYNKLLKKSPSKSTLRQTDKAKNYNPLLTKDTKNFEGNKSQSILNRSIERFNMSTAKYSEITKSFDKLKHEENNLRCENKDFTYNFRRTSSSFRDENKICKNGGFKSFYSKRDAELNEYNLNKMNGFEKEKLILFFEELINCENEIENAKYNLIIKEDFNAEDAFKLFELNGKGFLTRLDFKWGMHSLNIYPSNEEVSLLVRRFDLTGEGILSYNDFFEMICPVDKGYRTLLEHRMSDELIYRKNKPHNFLKGTTICFQDLLRILLDVECRIEILRQRFNRLSRFDLRTIFEKIDKLGKGYILDIDLINYFRSHEIPYSKKDIEFLFLRFDYNRDTKIQFSEFYEELYPKSNEDFLHGL